MVYVDPVSKKEIPVKSVYIPTQTLLQGKKYIRSSDSSIRVKNSKRSKHDK
jgi:hypothetical protein